MLEKIKADIKTSLLARDRFRVDTLKMAQSALMNARIEKRSPLSNDEEIQVIQKEIKKRREAASLYETAGEFKRASNESEEAELLAVYVPKMLSGVELSKAVDKFIVENQSLNFAEAMKKSISEFGNVDKSQLAGLLKSKLPN